MIEIQRGKIRKPCKAVVYGPESIGKSTLFAQPDSLYIDAESGTAELDIARTPRPKSWAHLRQILSDIAANQQGFTKLVIDTADAIERLAIAQVCAECGVKSLGGNKDYGASYNALAGLWSEFLTGLEVDFIDTGKMHVVLLAHSTTTKFELPEEVGAYDRYMLKLEKKTGAMTKEWSDLMCFCNFLTVVTINEKTKKAKAQGGQNRVMYTEHTAAFDAKNRYGLDARLDMEYASIARCFGQIAPSARVAPVASSTPAAATATTPIQLHAEAPAPAIVAPHAKPLVDLMNTSRVTWDDVLAVLVSRGKFPAGTPIEAIPADFINGYIMPYWTKITQAIQSTKGG